MMNAYCNQRFAGLGPRLALYPRVLNHQQGVTVNIKYKLLGAVLALSCGAAHAIAVTTVQTSSGLFTTKTGVCTVDFNSVASLTSCANATYSAGTASHLVNGSLSGQYAQPANDPTQYLTIDPTLGAVTISLAVGANYFGLYAGSIDAYNSIMFTGVDSSTVTLSGDQINAFLSGSPDANGSQNGYFNIFTGSLFNKITLTSTAAAFETDNHAFGIASAVPEPESLALLGLGALVMCGRRLRRRT